LEVSLTALSDLPTWEGFMVPVLQVSADGEVRTRRQMYSDVAAHMRLADHQLAETLRSGQGKADNRVGWALSFLVRAEALARPRRGSCVITDAGRELLARHSDGLTERDLQAIPAFRDYVPVQRRTASGSSAVDDAVDTALDPLEQIEQGVERLNADVRAELLLRLRALDPTFLEQSVLDVLMAMGYGGTDGQARRIGGTGDGGVDGVIDQDKLGLQRIYVQAKRYSADNTVGREAIQAFVGALHGRNVTQGIFITTSRFSPGAVEYAHSIGTRVVLIDGPRLAELMITYGVGVQARDTYRVVEVDEDYFE
jgi:restriction system protein